MTNTLPSLTLIGTTTLITDLVPFVDGSAIAGDPWINTIYKWTITVNLFGPQAHGDPSTRLPMVYDAQDIAVGDWVADISSGKAVKIVSILSDTTAFKLHAIVEDVERFNVFTDPSQSGFGGVQGSVVIFRLSPDGLPSLGGITQYSEHFIVNPMFATELTSRFRQRNYQNEYVRVYQYHHGFEIGDPVVLENNGTYVLAQANADHEGRIVGVVSSSKAPSNNWFAFKPVAPIIRDLIKPLPGLPGDLIFIDPTTPGQLTNEKPMNHAIALYIKLDDKTAILLSRNADQPINNLEAFRAPTNLDDVTHGYTNGSVWIDVVRQKSYTCIASYPNNAIWINNTPISLANGVVTNSITKSFPITIPSKNWLVNHGFNTMDFIYVCFDENGFQMIPNEVSPQDVNNIRFNFTQPCRGRVVVSFAV
jgi:hypothetical protein